MAHMTDDLQQALSADDGLRGRARCLPGVIASRNRSVTRTASPHACADGRR